MDRMFGFRKNEKEVFNVEKGSLNRVYVPVMAKNMDCDTEVVQKGYDDERWIEKSNHIKIRDNCTCQLCHAFNPSMCDMHNGVFIFVKQGEYETIHSYYWDGTNKYTIQVKGCIIMIDFDFDPGFHLVMPRLNVHHRIYYKNRHLWDYPDDCLITLCEKCHHYVHSLKELSIPIVEEKNDGHSVLIGRTKPKPVTQKFDHTDLSTFRPFALVKENVLGEGLTGQDLIDFKRAKSENKKWYDYQNSLDEGFIKYSSICVPNGPLNKYSKEESEKIVNFIFDDFMDNILGFSRTK